MIRIPLISSTIGFPQTNPDRTVNLYADKVGEDVVLECSPGLKVFKVIPGPGVIRGMLRFQASEEILFVVRGFEFLEYDELTSTFISRGLLLSSQDPVGMAYNSTQVIVVDNVNAYVYDIGNPLSFHIIDGSGLPFGGAFPFQGGNSTAVYASLRMLSLQPGTGNVFASDQDSAREWNPISGAESETFPDPLVAAVNIGQSLVFLGTDSNEVFVDQGLPIFPFRRVRAGTAIGCSAPFSVSVFGGAVYWLGGSREGRGIVYRMLSYDPEVISTTEISTIIQGVVDFSDAIGYIFQENGHVFYVINLLSGNRTLVYDISTGLWAEWEFRNEDGTTSRHPIITQAVYKQMNLVGDSRTPTIYEMSTKFTNNYGLPIVREKIFPPWPNDSYMLTNMPPFFVSMDVGQVPAGVDEPQAMLTWSDDRGKLYSNERYRGLGRSGDYGRRVVWDGLGSSFGRSYRLRLTGDVSFVIRGAGML